MIDQATLGVSIDASGATKGAQIFSRSASDIMTKATQIERAVDRTNRSFRSLSATASETSKTFDSAVSPKQVAQSLVPIPSPSRVIQNRRNLAKAKQKNIDDFDKLPFRVVPPPALSVPGALGDAAANVAKNADRKVLKDLSLQRVEQLRQEIDNFFLPSDQEASRKLIERALELLEGVQQIDEQDLAVKRTRAVALPKHLGRMFGPGVEADPFDTNRALENPELIKAQKLFGELLDQIEALDKEIEARRKEMDFLRGLLPNNGPIEGGRPPPTSPVDTPKIPANDESTPNGKDGNEPAQQLNDKISRGIDLLKEQNKLIEIGASLLSQQKGTQEQINGALQENQSLRGSTGGLTGGHSDDALEGAAAYDDLSTAIEQNGEAAKGLKDQVDSLNTVLQSNAGINAQIVGGLEQERDARRQVNGTIAERRQLEQDQGQRLIAEQKDVSDSAAEVDAAITQIKNAAKDAFRDVIKGTESVGDAFRKLADRITDILLDLALDELLKGGTGFSDLFNVVFGGIGSIFGGGNAAAFTGGAPGAATVGGLLKLPHGSPFHAGGVVGRDGGLPRPIAANVNSLPRFHAGGVTGLAPDEVPIIARRGEEVLTRGDPRHRDNAGAGGVVVNVTFPNARNTEDARQAGSEIAAKAAAAAQRGMARKGLG